MNNKGLVLFRTLLLSTSSINKYKTCADKKKRGKIIGGYIGFGFFFLTIIGYCVLIAMGYAQFGLVDQIPAMAAMLISILSFFFTMLKAGSYLFGFREYDMLMSLPFSEKTVVASKFMYMYMKNLPWNLSIAIAMLIGYSIFGAPAWYVYPLWMVLSLILPIIPMLAASFVGYLIARIGTSFKHWKVVQTILTFGFVLLAFSLRFIIENIFRNNEVSDVVEGVSEKTERAGNLYLPIRWFENSIAKGSIPELILLVVLSILLFEVTFNILAKSYKKINSTMKTGVAKHNFKLGALKKRSVMQAVTEKELRRFVGSTNYFVNVGFGCILALIVGIVSLFVGLDKIIDVVVNGAPVTVKMVLPAIPYVIYFLTGMVAMTVCSPSLEGKNYWIVKSSPITDRQLYGGKILANLYVSVPAQLLATLCMCISAKAPALETFGFMLLGGVLCIFSAIFGCDCGVSFMKLDWENEIEVIKQGTAVVVYMFPNMILTTGLIFLSIFLAKAAGTMVVILVGIIIYSVLSLIFAYRIKYNVKQVSKNL